MTATMTRFDAEIITDTDEESKIGNSDCSHIIREYDPETGEWGSAAAKITEARIEGTPLTALCGYVFTPSQDTKGKPVCPKCKEIYKLEQMFEDGFDDIDNLKGA